VSPWRSIISTIFALSGAPPAAASITSAASRKYCGPIAAGVIRLTTFAACLVFLLLSSLEDLGYIVRSHARDEGRGRIVNFTKREHAAYAKALEVLRDIEREWSEELGRKDFARLKELLCRVWESPLTR